MQDFNQAIVLGNLTKDPEMRFTANGQAVASFSIATNRRWTSKEGQPQEAVEFHNVVAWGKLAEICNQILYKGRKTLVVGRLQTRSWEGQDGVKRYTTEIVADHISATGSPRSAGESAISESIDNQTVTEENKLATKDSKKNEDKEKSAKHGSADSGKDEEINLDDIPF